MKVSFLTALAASAILAIGCATTKSLPDRMDEAYLLYGDQHFPITRTDKNANAVTPRRSVIEYDL